MIAAICLVASVAVWSEPAAAIEQSNTPTAIVSGTTSTSTLSYRPGLTASLRMTSSATPYYPRAAWLSSTTPHTNYGAVDSTFDPPLSAASTPTIGVWTAAGNCGGRDFEGNCPTGQLTVTFSEPVTDPILDISGIGGNAYCKARDAAATVSATTFCKALADATGPLAANSWSPTAIYAAGGYGTAQWDISTPGITFGAPSVGSSNLQVTPTRLKAANNAAFYKCFTPPTYPTTTPDGTYLDGGLGTGAADDLKFNYGDKAGCGSVTLQGTFTTVTFAMSINVSKMATADGWSNGVNWYDGTNGIADLHRMSIRVREDLGDAPASYDSGQAAYHVKGPLQLGAGITSDSESTGAPSYSPVVNPTTNLNSATPGADPATDTDDAIGDGVQAPVAIAGYPYSLTIPVSGNTTDTTLAGWIDWDDNGSFGSGERVSVTIPAGSATGKLTWIVPAATTGTGRYLRLRLAKDATQVLAATGGASTGEVEDYRLDIVDPAPAIEVVKYVNGDDANTAPGVTVASGSMLTFTFVVHNTGNVPLTGVGVTDDVVDAADITNLDPSWDGTLDPDEFTFFTATMPAPLLGNAPHTDTGTATGTPSGGGPPVSDSDVAHAITIPAPSIHVTKTIDNADANTPPGVLVAAGQPMAIAFDVWNDGNMPLHDVTLADDLIDLDAIVPPSDWDGTLDPGEHAVFTATITAPARGLALHTNTATARGTDDLGTGVSDDDPANATTIAEPGIEVVKSINGDDANTEPGVAVPAGSPMNVRFAVHNTGNVALHDVEVDDNVIDASAIEPEDPAWDGTLEPGEWAYFTATLLAPRLGNVLHTNIATATGVDPADTTVTDDDPANATTIAEPALTITKYVNGDDANTAPGIEVDAGAPMTFTFDVHNTGNIALQGVTVDDDVIPGADIVPDDPSWDGTLDPGEHAYFTAVLGAPTTGLTLHTNTATASGTDELGHVVTDSDVANATTRSVPGIEVIKRINGDDANVEPGVAVAAGSLMTFEFALHNTGNVPLHDVEVHDDVLGDAAIHPVGPGWNGMLAVGEWAYFTATLAADRLGNVLHTNTATVSGIDPVDTEVSDDDPANATTIPVPGVTIVKTDAAGNDADTTATAVQLDPDRPTTLRFTVTNTGNEPLVGFDVSDAVTGGTTVVSGLECEFPDGSAGTIWVGPLSVDRSFECTATLDPLGSGATHADVGKVTAVGAASAVPTDATDPFHATTPAAPTTTTTSTTSTTTAPTTTTTTTTIAGGAAANRSLAATGSNANDALTLAGLAITAGVVLLATRRPRNPQTNA